MRVASVVVVGLLVAVAAGCNGQPQDEEASMAPAGSLKLESSAFREGGLIPQLYTCDGEDRSPPLAWTGAPPGTTSYALIMDDPDAPSGTWDHWLVWNLKGSALGEGARDGVSGSNSWGTPGWRGPCPPSGTHRYVFRLLALDATLDLPPGTRKDALLAAAKGHVLAEARLVGRYARG
jgi:Raf kinase inhibitor-like YbhB/YbcL family protein